MSEFMDGWVEVRMVRQRICTGALCAVAKVLSLIIKTRIGTKQGAPASTLT
jgi:hypothetical protein